MNFFFIWNSVGGLFGIENGKESSDKKTIEGKSAVNVFETTLNSFRIKVSFSWLQERNLISLLKRIQTRSCFCSIPKWPSKAPSTFFLFRWLYYLSIEHDKSSESAHALIVIINFSVLLLNEKHYIMKYSVTPIIILFCVSTYRYLGILFTKPTKQLTEKR